MNKDYRKYDDLYLFCQIKKLRWLRAIDADCLLHKDLEAFDFTAN